MLPPGIRQGEQPPYHLLDEYLFQDMCCDLFHYEPEITSCSIYGTRGQSQYGIDLLAQRRDGGIEVGQCKKYSQFSARQIVQVSDEFFYHWDHWKNRGVKRFILFVSCPLDRQEQQEEILRQKERFKEFGIEYEVWHDRVLTMKLAPHPNIVGRYLSPADYWVSYICGPTAVPLVTQSRGTVVVSEILSNQLTHLSNRLANEMQSQLERVRVLWRQGRLTEALQWVKDIKDDTHVWLALPADLRARLLRFEASIELEQKADLSHVKQLAREAEGLCASCASIEGLRLKALITYREKGAAAAVQTLKGQEDVDTLNLKTALLLEMNEYDKCSQIIEHIMSRLIPNAETYRVRSLLNLCLGNLAQARLDAQEAINREPYWRSIQMAAAVVYYYSAMSAPALPRGIPLWPEPIAWQLIRRDNESLQHLESASQLFASLLGTAELDVEERRRLQVWRLASMANHPRLQDEALDYCRSVLEDDPSNAYVVAWAINRNMVADLTSSLTAFEDLIREGRASLLQIIIVVSFYLSNGMGSKALELLGNTRSIFEQNDAEDLWIFWKCQSLVVDGNLGKAFKMVDLLKDPHRARIAKITALRARASEKDDWQPLFDYLERCFSDTGDGMFLLDCCEIKARLGKWTYVADRSTELVNHVGTADAVELAAQAMFKAGRHAECLTLLDRFQRYFTDSKLPANLRRIRVECQRSLGILPRAVSEAEELVRGDPAIPNLLVLAQLYLSLGDLKGVALVAQQIESRSDSAPEHCLRLARLVQWDDQNLAVSLWRKAANSNCLPDELVGEAVALGYQLRLDAEMRPLVKRMADLGEQARGGIQKKSIEDLFAIIDQQRKNLSKVEELYRNGRTPVHLAAEALNIPLARMYRTMLLENEDRLCGYECLPLYCRHGGRPIGLETDKPVIQWRLHMDVTAVLLAAHLGVLEKVVEVFRPIKIPASLVPSLVAMRDKVTPHQPSHATAYRRILDLIRESKIRTIDPPKISEADSTLVQELGSEWVALWEYARKNDGYLVDFLPLRKRDLSGPPTALPEDAGMTLINCRAVVESLRQFGPLSKDEYFRALDALGAEGLGADVKVVPVQHKTLVLDTAIPKTLAEAGLIELVCDRFDVVIKDEEARRIETILQEYEAAQELSNWLGGIIGRISRGLRNGVYEVIPTVGPGEPSDKEIEMTLELDGLYSLLRFEPQPGDVIWADDRALTSYRHRDGGVPIIGIIEVLDALLGAGRLDKKEYFGLLAKLRAANVRFIPLRASEILHHLMQARVQDGRVVETQELIVLRRYVANCLADGAALQRPVGGQANPGEIPFVSNLGREVTDAIITLWKTADTDLEACQARADWIMESLYLDHLARASVIGLSLPNEDIYLAALGIADLLLAALHLEAKDGHGRYSARRQYFAWLETCVLRSRFAAEPRLIGAVAEVFKMMLNRLDEPLDRNIEFAWKYGIQGFYEDLPEPLREELNRDREFIASIGIRVFSVVEIGRVKFEINEFVRAVSEVINGRPSTAKPLDPSEPEAVFEPDTDSPSSCVVIHPWNSQPVPVRDEIFELLREHPAEREAALRRNRQWFDCSLEEFNKVVAEIAALPDPLRRLEEAEQWRKTSISVYYQRLEETLVRHRALARSNLGLPSADRLCWYFRLPPNTGDGEEFQKSLHQAAEEVLKESELINTLERFCALPVPLPLTLVQRVQRLDPSERHQLVKALLKSTGSPLSRIHLLRILTVCSEKRYLRLARRIMVRMLGDTGAAEFDAFKAVLDWVEAESGAWSAGGLSNHIRLAMVWAHAHFLYTVVVGAGAPTSWVTEVFRNLSGNPSLELFRREPSYWFDVSHPRQVNRASFLLSGFAYALGDLADRLMSPQIRERLVALACVLTEEVQLPSPSMLRDSTRCRDALGSFLGGDRGQTLRFLLGQEKAELLSSKSIRSTLNLALKTLGAEPTSTVAWAIVLNILTWGALYEDVVPRLVELFKGTDYTDLYKRDAKCGLIALRAATFQMASIRNEELRTHLIQQIREVVAWCSESEKQAPKIADAVSTREVGLSLLECALNVCLGQETDEKVITSFVEVTSMIMHAWPQLRREYKDILELLCQRLPVSACKPIWRLINLARTF